MERHAFAMKVKDDMMNSYRQKLEIGRAHV